MVHVSVIIPTLNEAGYLERCLGSLATQTFKDFETIVADSFSTDGTGAIAREWGATIVQTPPRGPGAGRNAGARQAKGGILLFMDADTVASRNLLEEIIAALDSDDSIVFGSCRIIPLERSRLIGRFTVELVNLTYRSVVRLGFPQIVGLCCFFRASVFRSIGGFSEHLLFGEDEELGWRARILGRQAMLTRAYVATSLRRYKEFGYPRLSLYYLLNKLKFALRRDPLRIRYFPHQRFTTR